MTEPAARIAPHAEDARRLRRAMDDADMTPNRLARVMVSLGDPRTALQINRDLQRLRGGVRAVSGEMWCLLTVLRTGWTPGEDREPAPEA